MRQTSIVLASLFLLAGCAKGSGATPGAVDPTGAAGTPDSLFPQSTEDGAGGGAGDGANAFVRKAFDAGAAGVVKASCAPGKLRLTLDGVLFEFDRDTLQRGADDILSQIKKAAFDAYPTSHVVVEGHTDSVGNDAHNDDLSARRAKTVLSWFEAHGVDAGRLASKGFGKRWPRWPNDTDANRAKNRRVELVVLDTTAAKACNQPQDPIQGKVSGAAVAASGDGGVPPSDTGNSHGAQGPTGQPENHPLAPEAFSYLYDGHADLNSHTCFTTDPAWAPRGPIPLGYPKKGFGHHDGQFVDHCPTEGLVATCDTRSFAPAIFSYYREVPEAVLAIAERSCAAGKWTRLVPAAPTPKIQPDTGTYAAVCNRPAAHQCIEVRPDATPDQLLWVKGQCALDRASGAAPASGPLPRCPTQGASGRCENQGNISYYYDPTAIITFRYLCSGPGAMWSAP